MYLSFLKDWRFPYEREPLQTLKSFIILVSGCETAQRAGAITFVVTDRQKIWKDDSLFDILEAGVAWLKKELGVAETLDFDELDIIGKMPTGRYYCGMCQKFFAFSLQRKSITCPPMPQKCMATPLPLEKSKYSLEHLRIVYDHTSDIYRRLMSVFPNREEGATHLRKVLQEDWAFELEEEPLAAIVQRLGLA